MATDVWEVRFNKLQGDIINLTVLVDNLTTGLENLTKQVNKDVYATKKTNFQECNSLQSTEAPNK